MTQALRLVFDDCLSKHAVAKLCDLAKFSRGTVEIAHLATLNLSGQLDDEWIPSIESGGWVIVTTDRGKKVSRGGKLPAICRRHGVTHVMMSAAIHALNQFDKVRAILTVWLKLIRASEAARGTGYLLKKTNEHAFDLVALVPRTPDDEQIAKTQKQLPLADQPPP